MAKIKLIADSGATKAEWCLVGAGKTRTIHTQGISPYFLDTNQIRDLLQKELLPKLRQTSIDEVYYYGTGCANPANAKSVARALRSVLPDASIEVNHDLLAAARALCGREQGIACILGTGSNSCFYNGKKIVRNSPGLGYVLGDEEFMAALERLKKEGLRQLIYDLRGNGGGFMNEAIDMADEFLDAERLVVYTQGANSRKEEYFCKRPGLFETGKLVILIDELSASASEVLAGALQDWDRAKIVGRRSFGKGLVQLQYGLSDGSAIRLTTARYYTPLGRSIQRPYDHGKKVYMDELWERYQNGEVLYADSNKYANGTVYVTPAGDTLYGGGGIMPDHFVPIDTTTYPSWVNRLFIQGYVNNFIYNYYLDNRAQIDGYKTVVDFEKRFAGGDELWNRFRDYMKSDSVSLRDLDESTRSTVERRMAASLARFKWRNNGYFQVVNEKDPMIVEAMKVLAK